MNTSNYNRQWHCQVYWYENKNLKLFLYAFAIQTSYPHSFSQKTIHISNTLKCFSTIIPERNFKIICSTLEEGTFSLTYINDSLANIDQAPIKAFSSEIRPVCGYSATVFSWHTFLSFDAIDSNLNTLTEMLKTLEENTQLAFTKEHAGLLGAFEIYQVPEWIEDYEPPFAFSFKCPDLPLKPEAPDYLIIRRRPDFANQKHFLSIKLFSKNCLIYSQLHVLPPGKTQLGPIEVGEHFDETECQLFDESGKLIYDDKSSFLEICISTLFLDGTKIKLEGDKVSTQAEGIANKTLTNKTQVVTIQSQPLRSTLILASPNKARAHIKAARDKAKELFPPNLHDKWFDMGIIESLEALAHILSLIKSHDTIGVMIADPFFDLSALSAFIPRIGIKQLPIKIVTNLRPKLENNTNTEWENLLIFIDKNRHLLHCNLHITNLIRRDFPKVQAFHDRYLILQKESGMSQVYLLSNSLNSRASNFPFCMSFLEDSVAKQVEKYIRHLMQGKDQAGLAVFDVNEERING